MCQVVTVKCDVSDAEQVQRAVEKAIQVRDHGGIP